MNAIELETNIKNLIPEEVLKALKAEAVRRKMPLAKLMAEIIAAASREITRPAAA